MLAYNKQISQIQIRLFATGVALMCKQSRGRYQPNARQRQHNKIIHTFVSLLMRILILIVKNVPVAHLGGLASFLLLPKQPPITQLKITHLRQESTVHYIGLKKNVDHSDNLKQMHFYKKKDREN